VGADLAALVARLLAKDPADRPASAREVKRELDDIALNRGLDTGLGETLGEETVDRSKDLMLSACLGYRIDMLTQEQRDDRAKEIRAMSSRIEDNITFLDQLGGTDFEAFVASVKHLVLAEGCKVVVLDHLSMLMDSVELNVDQRRAIDKAMKRIKEMAVEMKFVMILLSHLSRVDGKSHEEGARPQFRDLRGSHSIAQVPDFVVALQRNPQGGDSNSTKCYLLKNRCFGQVGLMGKLVYDQSTGRLIDQPFSFGAFDE
jgi:twinkle protein